jgi:hypothetical protein
MYDLHLAIHMFLYVYAAYTGNAAGKSWLAPYGYAAYTGNAATRMPIGGIK